MHKIRSDFPKIPQYNYEPFEIILQDRKLQFQNSRTIYYSDFERHVIRFCYFLFSWSVFTFRKTLTYCRNVAMNNNGFVLNQVNGLLFTLALLLASRFTAKRAAY